MSIGKENPLLVFYAEYYRRRIPVTLVQDTGYSDALVVIDDFLFSDDAACHNGDRAAIDSQEMRGAGMPTY